MESIECNGETAEPLDLDIVALLLLSQLVPLVWLQPERHRECGKEDKSRSASPFKSSSQVILLGDCKVKLWYFVFDNNNDSHMLFYSQN